MIKDNLRHEAQLLGVQVRMLCLSKNILRYSRYVARKLSSLTTKTVKYNSIEMTIY